jgi:predicted aldo/keto reductase-like oxidoreductase
MPLPLRPFGRARDKVSILGLGGHHLGELKTVTEAIALVHEAIDSGITFFDNCWELQRTDGELAGTSLEKPSRQSFSDDQGLHPWTRFCPGPQNAR